MTDEQAIAAASPERGVYIVAAPGSGKTAVSAYRFGALAYTPTQVDPAGRVRGVLATSFTRAATAELRRRIVKVWGPAVLGWPHQVVTIDTLVGELVTHLLEEGLLTWPGGHKRLRVHDSWETVAETVWTKWTPKLWVASSATGGARTLSASSVRGPRPVRMPWVSAYRRLVAQGICTHDDVRHVLEQLIDAEDVRRAITARLAARYRALIVDEVFDANAMDLALVELAAAAGAEITIVGDPWQAVYDFRGARSSLIKPFAARLDLTELPLNRSFRWKTDQQDALARKLRASEPVTLPAAADLGQLDVVLGSTWKPLWKLGPQILPLAFQSTPSDPEEAAATLVLHRMAEQTVGQPAAFLRDALTSLLLDEKAFTAHVEGRLDEVLAILDDPTRTAADAWDHLAALLELAGARELQPRERKHVKRLELLHDRRGAQGRTLVPATTAHQAKGGEWDNVGVHLSASEQKRLATGLDPDSEDDRKVYVACTRAKGVTVQVMAAVEVSRRPRATKHPS